jgi:hypothetical protein
MGAMVLVVDMDMYGGVYGLYSKQDQRDMNREKDGRSRLVFSLLCLFMKGKKKKFLDHRRIISARHVLSGLRSTIETSGTAGRPTRATAHDGRH